MSGTGDDDDKATYFEGNLMPCAKCDFVYLCCYVLNECRIDRNAQNVVELRQRKNDG